MARTGALCKTSKPKPLTCGDAPVADFCIASWN
jgi:hypothetical protein